MKLINLIPLSKNPFQSFQIDINKQNCNIELMQKRSGLFFSLAVDDEFLVRTVLCQNINYLILYGHIKFTGNLFFIDTEGNSDPVYHSLNDRYILVYTDKI